MRTLIPIALTLLFACHKTHYSSDCTRAVPLAQPWDTMKLPLDGNSRVCSSNDLKTDVEHLDGDRAGWEGRYDQAMTALGYAKERCSSTSCSYTKAGERVSVQVNQVAAGKKAKTIVHLNRTPAPPPK